MSTYASSSNFKIGEMRMDNAQDLAPKVPGVKQIAQTADVWAFEAYNLAVRRPPR